MQFIDEAEISAKAGDGGAGAVAFRREKFVPRGGPSGGDGGNGGDIVLETDERLSTLLDFRFRREYRARNGEPGRGRDQNGHAAPKIADYPFTTLQPHLGVVQYKDGRSFVLSDLPGLIEGAHRGAGLGHRFLKHMARCRTIIHLIDASQDRDLIADFDAINRELELFDPALGRKSQVVAANKIDLPEARARGEDLRKKLKRRKIDVHLVSGATGEGLAELVDATVRALDSAPMPSPLERDVHPAAPGEE